MAERKRDSVWVRITLAVVIIGVWLAAAGIGGPYFGKIDEVSNNDMTVFLPSSAEATKVNDIVEKFQDASSIPAILAFERLDEGTLSESDVDALSSLAPKFKNIEGVTDEVAPAQLSDDKKAALVVVPIDSDAEVDEVLESIRGVAKERSSFEVAVGGPAAFSSELKEAFSGIDGLLLGVALAVVFIILLFVYRSPFLPFIVLMTSIFALAASILLVWNLANAGLITLNGQVQGILFILVIGAATDYSLLFVARYKEELYQHTDKLKALTSAWKASVEPIVASGGTVIVGLLCLLLSDLGSNKALGPVGATGIAFAMLAALTLLPALLYAVGRKVFWPFAPKAAVAARTAHDKKRQNNIWSRVGSFVDAHPRKLWIGIVIALLIPALGAGALRADGTPQSDLVLGSSEAREAQQVVSDHFAPGSGSPVLVVTNKDSYADTVKRLDKEDVVERVTAIGSNSSGQVPLGEASDEIRDTIRASIAANFDTLPGVAAQGVSIDSLVDKAYPFNESDIKIIDDKIVLQATLNVTSDSDEAKNFVQMLRNELPRENGNNLVGGMSAISYDTETASNHDRWTIIPIILVAITIIIMILLRSVIAPLLLLATTVLSFFSALGVAAFVFNDILELPPLDPAVVLYSFVFLVALGIDYNIFLMTRVREEVQRIGHGAGVIKGLVVTGAVITSAGVVLAATFAALAVIPIVFLVQLAFIVSFGVLLDTIIVRSLLVPALMKDIGPFVWWPSRLRKKP